MNKITFKILTLLLGVALLGCEPSKKEVADELEKELIAEHDEAMAKMEHIQHTLSTLNKERTEFMLDSASHHAAHLDECDKSIADLEAADKLMMDWMHEYAELSKKTRTDEERIVFYEEEHVKIRNVSEQMTIAVKEGEHFVRKFYIDKAEHDKKMHELEKEASEKIDSTKNTDVEV